MLTYCLKCKKKKKKKGKTEIVYLRVLETLDSIPFSSLECAKMCYMC